MSFLSELFFFYYQLKNKNRNKKPSPYELGYKSFGGARHVRGRTDILQFYTPLPVLEIEENVDIWLVIIEIHGVNEGID